MMCWCFDTRLSFAASPPAMHFSFTFITLHISKPRNFQPTNFKCLTHFGSQCTFDISIFHSRHKSRSYSDSEASGSRHLQYLISTYFSQAEINVTTPHDYRFHFQYRHRATTHLLLLQALASCITPCSAAIAAFSHSLHIWST
jgi:hypothetical protein